jgi:hypothetical protein
MNLASHSKLDLPIFSETEVAWTSSDIRATAASGQPEFVRRTCLEHEGPAEDLTTVLAIADLVLDRVCDYIHAGKVGYTWGLAPVSKQNLARLGEDYHNDHDLLPAGYGLVACVENIAGAQAIPSLSPWDRQLRSSNPSGIRIRINDKLSVSSRDLGPEQFVLRPCQEEPDLDSAVLVDIEPRLRVHAW